MSRHFIHYLHRVIKARQARTPEDLFYTQEQDPTDGLERPAYHITRRKSGPVTMISPGDSIWLLSSLSAPWGTLPPSVDARIVVSSIEHLPDGRTKFHAGSRSEWFPLCDARSVISLLTTVDRLGTVKRLKPDD